MIFSEIYWILSMKGFNSVMVFEKEVKGFIKVFLS